MACALFGIVAVDLRHGPMLRTYASLLVFLVALDVTWHEFWAERLKRNYTGVREDAEMWWGVMVANTNKICGFAMEMAGAITRGVSLLIWGVLWYGDRPPLGHGRDGRRGRGLRLHPGEQVVDARRSGRVRTETRRAAKSRRIVMIRDDS